MGITYPGPATFFSFDTMGGSSSLNVVLPSGPICVGAVAAFGADGCGLGGVNGYLHDHAFGVPYTTQELPVVTLVSSTTVPEPPTWALMLTGLAALGFVSGRKAGGARS